MANNFDSNITRPLARVFLEKFESMRVMSKNVNTQLLQGKFNPSTGDTVDVKRPTDYTSVRTPKGDITAETPSDIVTGKASGIVQDYFTTFVDYDEADEAIQMDQIDQLLAPLATRIVTDLELDFAAFMAHNSALVSTDVAYAGYGASIKNWGDVANAGALMSSIGIPTDAPWYMTVNPYTQVLLADVQATSIGSVDSLISPAFRRATISEDFAGMRVMKGTTLPLIVHSTGADRAGVLTAAGNQTYVAAKDTMTFDLAVSGFTSGLVVNAGELITITGGPHLLNQSTREAFVNGVGANIEWTGTVTTAVTLTGGAGTIVVTGAPVFDTVAGAVVQQSVDSVFAGNEVATLQGTQTTSDQPALFWHRDAFALASVPIKKLHSTDTLATTEDGLQFRVSKGSDFLANSQSVRFDFRPAYGVLNPYFAGQAWSLTA